MSSAPYSIPPEFRHQLRLREPTEKRSDAAILAALNETRPVTSEKNVWAFWHSGLLSMPAWSQRNVVDWVRILDASWTVRVLDAVPGSSNYMLNYLPASSLNDAMVHGKMDGDYTGPHSADLLRGACLIEHGGVFMDVGIILMRDLDRICWNQLADPTSPFQVSVPWMYGLVTANHFVASRKGDPFIRRWHTLFLHLWEGRTNCKGLMEDPLLAFAKGVTFDDSRAGNFHWDWKISAETLYEYITQVVCWQRVCMLASDGFDGPEYWHEHILLWDVLKENWGGEATVGFEGQKMFDLLSLRLDSDTASAAYAQAHQLVYRLLTLSSMQKITHGKNLTTSVHLGVLWDESPGKDCQPGTFAELLRYGTVHFEQTRDEIDYVKAPEAPVMRKGLLEP